MKTIKILGSGCPKCQQTEEVVKEAIAKFGIAAEIEKVEDIRQILQYNILTTPVVIIDEIVKIKGRVPNINEVKAALS